MLAFSHPPASGPYGELGLARSRAAAIPRSLASARRNTTKVSRSTTSAGSIICYRDVTLACPTPVPISRERRRGDRRPQGLVGAAVYQRLGCQPLPRSERVPGSGSAQPLLPTARTLTSQTMPSTSPPAPRRRTTASTTSRSPACYAAATCRSTTSTMRGLVRLESRRSAGTAAEPPAAKACWADSEVGQRPKRLHIHRATRAREHSWECGAEHLEDGFVAGKPNRELTGQFNRLGQGGI